MAKPKRDNERAARALADAALLGDRKACEKHAITDRTLRNYRAALQTDPELSWLFQTACTELTRRHWAEELNDTLNAATQKLKALILNAHSTDPETITAITQAVLGMAELALTRDILATRTEGEGPQLTHKSALVQPNTIN